MKNGLIQLIWMGKSIRQMWVKTGPLFSCRNLRKWIQNYQNPSAPKPSTRPHSASDSYKHSGTESYKHSGTDSHKSNKPYDKSHDDSNNSGKQYRDKQKLKQQQYFAQQNQSEFQEFLQFKDSKTRGREAREQRKQRSGSPRKEAYQTGGYSGNQGYSPSFKQDKKQYQILVSNSFRVSTIVEFGRCVSVNGPFNKF